MLPQVKQGLLNRLHEYEAEEIKDALKYEELAGRLDEAGQRELADIYRDVARDERKHAATTNKAIRQLGRIVAVTPAF